MNHSWKPTPGHLRIMEIRRDSATQITYDLEDGTSCSIEVDPSFADFVMEAWEEFLKTPGDSDSPGG